MTAPDLDPVLLAAALEEALVDMRRLELERWTRYQTDPDAALRDLVRREHPDATWITGYRKDSAA